MVSPIPGRSISLTRQGIRQGDLTISFPRAGPARWTPVGESSGRLFDLRSGSDGGEGLPMYAACRWEDAYPGIDILWRAGETGWEYDFQISAGADPERIRVRFDGLRARVLPDGALAGEGAGFRIRQAPMRAFQARRSGPTLVPCRPIHLGPGEFGIRLEGRDPALPTYVDPVIEYRRDLSGADTSGGADPDAPWRPAPASALDAAGNLYLAGSTSAADVGGIPRPPGDAGSDAFVARLSPTGEDLQYLVYVGGRQGSESDVCLDVTPDGRAVLAGSTDSPDFPLTLGGYRPRTLPAVGAFVSRLSRDGGRLEWSLVTGGRGRQRPAAVVAAADGSVILAGQTDSPDFPTSPTARQRTLRGASDGFLCRFNATGSALIAATLLGGPGDEGVSSTVRRLDGSLVACGWTTSGLQLAGGLPAIQHGPGGGIDVWVAVLDSSLRRLSQPVLLGGSGPDEPAALQAGVSDSWVVAGRTLSGDFPITPGAHQPLPSGGMEGFVAGLSGEFGLLFGAYLGTETDDALCSLEVDAVGQCWLAGVSAPPAAAPDAAGTTRLLMLHPGGDRVPVVESVGPGSIESGARILAAAGRRFWLVSGASDPQPAPGLAVTRVNAADVADVPAPPAQLRAREDPAGGVDLAWRVAGDAEAEILVERAAGGAQPAFAEIARLAPNTRLYRDESGEGGTSYVYRILAANAAGRSAPSNLAGATAPAPPPGAPGELAARVVSSGRVDLTWTPPATPWTGYQLERRGGRGGFGVIAQPPAGATSYADTSVQPNTTYGYRLYSQNGGTLSSPSPVVTVTTPSQGRLQVTPPALNLLTTPVGASRSAVIRLRNRGGGPLRVTIGPLDPFEPAFAVSGIGSTVTIPARRTHQVAVTFSPAFPGAYSSTLRFTSDEGAAAGVIIQAQAR